MTESESQQTPTLPHFDVATLSPDLQEKLARMSLEAYYKEYDGMQEFMQDIVDPDTDTETRLSFEDEGYDVNYGTAKNGFYDLGPRPQVILHTLTELQEKGTDTTKAEAVFKGIAGSVWKNAPRYYETRPDTYKVETPVDYDPEDPYPHVFRDKNKDRV